MNIILTNMPPTKNQLVHGTRISCEIDGVKIDDARISNNGITYITICSNKGNKHHSVKENFGYEYTEYISDSEIDSDKYKIRLVEEEKENTETITEKRWGILNNGKLSSIIYDEEVVTNMHEELVELTISYSLPKLKEITKEEAEKLLDNKYKII